MSILMIRARKRYAVRSSVNVRRDDESTSGLLIELSAEGARVSNLGSAEFTVGQTVAVMLETGDELCGRIRWARSGVAGVKLDPPLYPTQLAGVLDSVRGEDVQQVQRFGT